MSEPNGLARLFYNGACVNGIPATPLCNGVAVGREGAKKVCFQLPGPLLTEASIVECKRMRGTSFGAKNVESIFGKL
jgi:hypothetical protein